MEMKMKTEKVLDKSLLDKNETGLELLPKVK